MVKVVGRSGCVMDLPEQLAGCLLRDGSVKLVEEESSEGQDEPKPRKPARKSTSPRRQAAKTEE